MVQGIAARRKRYVEVEATFLEDGRIVPRAVIWHDGRRFPVRAVLGVPLSIRWRDGRTFEIDRVHEAIRRASTRVGGTGIRYLVTVHGRDKYLFFEDPRWFVEEIVYEPLDPLLDGGACAWGAD